MKKLPLIIANWKMELSLRDCRTFLRIFASRFSPYSKRVRVVLSPSFEHLSFVAQQLPHTLFLGAQNCFWETKGAFTGEVSPSSLHSLGVRYVLLGHSERRRFLKEDDDMIRHKMECVANLRGALTPVLCVEDPRQLRRALKGVSFSSQQNVCIAYEPSWAVGTGDSPNPSFLRQHISALKKETQQSIPFLMKRHAVSFLYGGSADEKNGKEFLSDGGVDGLLVGTASIKAASFLALIKKVCS